MKKRTKIKIGYYCADVDPEKTKSIGIYKTSLSILEELLKEPKFEIVLFLTKKNKHFFKKYSCKKRILKIISNNRIINRLWLDQIEVNRAAKKENIDILFFPKGMIPVKKLKGIKYATIVYDLIPHYYIKNGKYQFILGYLFLLNSIKKADILFTPSNYSKKQILSHVKRDITIIPLGIPINGGETKLKNYKITKPYFFVSGNKNFHKNLERSIKLVKEYNTLYKKNYGIFYPTRGLEDGEMAYIYKNAELCIFLSDMEGLGYATLEAYSFNIPVVFNNKTGIQEVAEELKIKKGACNINDKNSVFNAINEVLKMNKNEINENRIRLIKKYNWKKCGEKIIKTLKKIS